MRILIHSNAPFVPSGYGVQTKLLIPRLTEMGHEVAVSAFYGLRGAPIVWNGINIFPAGLVDYGIDVLCQHANAWEADLVLFIMDYYKMHPLAKMLASHPFKVAAWAPVDCSPLSKLDEATMKLSECYPVAMSRFGQTQLTHAGFPDVPVIPHAVDTSVYTPPEDYQQLRKEIGTEGEFVIGICAANNDAVRKAFPEQLRAFARFSKRHKDAVLMLHTLVNTTRGWDLGEMIRDFGIEAKVMLSDQYIQIAGMFPEQGMAAWYGGLDLLSLTSFAEGFGVPLIEAQSCGTPVVATDGTAAAELVGSGYTVKSREFWNAVHRAYWRQPDVDVILRSYEKAYDARGNQANRNKAREFALQYDTHAVAARCWKPWLEKMEEL